MLTVQVAYKNGTNNNWNDIARYATRRGADNFIAKNRNYYPEDVFNIRIIGEEQVKNKPQDYRKLVKVGDVFVGSYGHDVTFYSAYIVVGFTPSGKSLKVKNLFKTNISDKVSGYGPCVWGIRFTKPSDEYMQNSESVKTVRALTSYNSIYFNVSFIFTRTMFLEKDFDYNKVYVEGRL